MWYSFAWSFGHELHLQFPPWEIAALDCLEEVALVRLAVLCYYGLGLAVGEVLYALEGDEVEFHPCALVVVVDEAVSMASESVHVAE